MNIGVVFPQTEIGADPDVIAKFASTAESLGYDHLVAYITCWGQTAYSGLLRVGEPKAGEAVVVSAASGAVDSVVGQFAKIKGCRAVGVAGGKTKCDYVINELGFDACVDYKAPDFPAQLAAACPNGADVYF